MGVATLLALTATSSSPSSFNFTPLDLLLLRSIHTSSSTSTRTSRTATMRPTTAPTMALVLSELLLSLSGVPPVGSDVVDSDVVAGVAAVMVGDGGKVSTDEPSTVGINGGGITAGVESVTVEDRVVGIGSATGKHLDALLLLYSYKI